MHHCFLRPPPSLERDILYGHPLVSIHCNKINVQNRVTLLQFLIKSSTGASFERAGGPSSPQGKKRKKEKREKSEKKDRTKIWPPRKKWNDVPGPGPWTFQSKCSTAWMAPAYVDPIEELADKVHEPRAAIGWDREQVWTRLFWMRKFECSAPYVPISVSSWG